MVAYSVGLQEGTGLEVSAFAIPLQSLSRFSQLQTTKEFDPPPPTLLFLPQVMDQGSPVVLLGTNNDEHRLLHPPLLDVVVQSDEGIDDSCPPPLLVLPPGSSTEPLRRSTSLTSLSTVSDLEEVEASSQHSSSSGHHHDSILAPEEGEEDLLSSTVEGGAIGTTDASVVEAPPSSSSSSAVNKRVTDHRGAAANAAAVQHKVQQTWRERRETRDASKKPGSTTAVGAPGSAPSSSSSVNSKPSSIPKKMAPPPHQPLRQHHSKPVFAFPPLCAVVQKTWTQAFDSGKGGGGGANKGKAKKSKEDRPKVFPSMLSILQSNALVSHVRDLREDDDEEEEDDDDIVLNERYADKHPSDGSTARSSDSPRDRAPSPTMAVVKPTSAAAVTIKPPSDPAVQSVLSILPAGYDWNSAILQMAQSRSRAFLLLDLAAIVRRTVLWKRLHPQITWVHSVSANANPKLLQVLLVAGVRLATTTRTDLALALSAKSKLKAKPPLGGPTLHNNSQQQQRLVADSTSHTAPPDSYLRELLNARVTRLTVDGPDEVHRVVKTAARIRARRGGGSSSSDDDDIHAPMPLEPLELVLRLPNDPSKWESAVKATLQAVRSYPQHRLAGVSLDVGTTEDQHRERQTLAEQALHQILAASSDDTNAPNTVQIHLTGLEDWAVALPSSDASAASSLSGSSSLAAAAPPFETPFPSLWVQWWGTIQKREPRVTEIAVECSHPLIASAGALCTRIIGVRESGSDNAGTSAPPSGSGDDLSDVPVPLPKQSLYIDDGCYGSLYQTKGDLHPIPLGNYKNPDPAGTAAANAYSTTVWGPTCDGLDRVCRDIRLPKLERDDWLVFPNLGCPGGLGTAFNGFEPPDTAYCVLGYFK